MTRVSMLNCRTFHMAKCYTAINLAFLFWLLALISWHFDTKILASVLGTLSIAGFIIHIRQNQVQTMFKKNKQVDTLPITEKQLPAAVDDKSTSGMKNNDTTVIAKNVSVEGNIISSGHVYIYGHLKGDINTEDGVIKIMHGGEVDGNITSKEIIVDGNMSGHCISDSLEIAENGKVSGTITYNRLSIKKGGAFSGQAEMLPQNAKKGEKKSEVESKPADVTASNGGKSAR